MYQEAEVYLEETNPYLIIIGVLKYRLEGMGLTIVNEETRDGKIHIILASGEIGGSPVRAVVTYFAWPRIIRISIELTAIKKKKLKRHLIYGLLNMINNRLCPGNFRINESGHITLEAGMFAFEHIPEEDGADWPLAGEYHLLLDHLRTAAETYLPLIKSQVGSSGSAGAVIRSIEEGLKIKNRSSLQDVGVELE